MRHRSTRSPGSRLVRLRSRERAGMKQAPVFRDAPENCTRLRRGWRDLRAATGVPAPGRAGEGTRPSTAKGSVGNYSRRMSPSILSGGRRWPLVVGWRSFRLYLSRGSIGQRRLGHERRAHRGHDDGKTGNDKSRRADERSASLQRSRPHRRRADRVSDRDPGSGIASSRRNRSPPIHARVRGRSRGVDSTASGPAVQQFVEPIDGLQAFYSSKPAGENLS